MDNETTLRLPVINPDGEITQPIPVLAPFPDVKLTVPVKVAVPWRLMNDPIMTMPAPEWDSTPVFDRIYGPPQRTPEPVKKPRRKIPTADKVLVGMAATTVLTGVMMYGMVAYGWGEDPLPESPALTAPVKPSQSPEQSETPAKPPRASYGPVAPSVKPVETMATPEAVRPEPTRTIVVIPAPEPTPEPEVTTEPAPEPTTEEPADPPTDPAPEPPEEPSTPDPADPPSDSVILPDPEGASGA